MTSKDASKLVVRLLGISTMPAQVLHDLDSLMELIMQGRQESVQKSTVKNEPNNLPAEENTINLQDVDHFEMPKEINVQMEGEEAVRKIKIFPDGVSEAPPAEATN